MGTVNVNFTDLSVKLDKLTGVRLSGEVAVGYEKSRGVEVQKVVHIIDQDGKVIEVSPGEEEEILGALREDEAWINDAEERVVDLDPEAFRDEE